MRVSDSEGTYGDLMWFEISIFFYSIVRLLCFFPLLCSQYINFSSIPNKFPMNPIYSSICKRNQNSKKKNWNSFTQEKSNDLVYEIFLRKILFKKSEIFQRFFSWTRFNPNQILKEYFIWDFFLNLISRPFSASCKIMINW